MVDQKQFNGTVTFKGSVTSTSTVNLNGTTKCSGENSKFNYISDPVSVQGATNLLTGQSGAAVLIVPPNDVVLPAASPAGQRFEFVLAADVSSGTSTVKTAAGTEHFIGGITTGAGGKSMAPANADTATFGANADAGDRFECVSSGTHWYIVGGFCEASDGLEFSDAG